VLLPVENTTAEAIARWIGERLRTEVLAASRHPLHVLRVQVEENFGQWATCELPLEREA
jgi:6-pyruvoyltetrahydropterin/6-carboxytetrahydropterin synthase